MVYASGVRRIVGFKAAETQWSIDVRGPDYIQVCHLVSIEGAEPLGGGLFSSFHSFGRCEGGYRVVKCKEET